MSSSSSPTSMDVDSVPPSSSPSFMNETSPVTSSILHQNHPINQNHQVNQSPFLWSSSPSLCTPSNASGPIVLSNWIIPSTLCVGGYPSASELTKAHSYANVLVTNKFNCYVNMMTSNELHRFRPYADIISYKSLSSQPKYQPEFIHFPIQDGSIPKKNEEFIALIYTLIQRLKAGCRMYIHCWGGHGRTGTVVSTILAVMHPTRTADEALELCQELHRAREYNGQHSSPEAGQHEYVRAIVEEIRKLDATYVPPSSFQLQHLAYEPYEPMDPMDESESGSSSNQVEFTDVRAKSRAKAAARARASPPAGFGSGVIVVDPYGTASTTQANSSMPSTPLMSPARLGMIGKAVSGLLEPPQLLQREMVPITDMHRPQCTSSASCLPFTLLQMNVLADTLCDMNSFPNTAPTPLDWSHRKGLLIDELVGSNRVHSLGGSLPSIITMQECDHFTDWFQPELLKYGYTESFFFKKKSDDSKDGVAVFIKNDAFKVCAQESMILPGMNQVIILLQLVPLTNGVAVDTRRLYVVTTHLKAKEGFELIRLKQVQLILHALQQFIAKYHPTNATASSPTSPLTGPSSNPPHASLGFTFPTNAAVIFSGDFNDVPQSWMYNYITTGCSEVDVDEIKKKVDNHADTSTSGFATPTKRSAGPSSSSVSPEVTALPPPPPAAVYHPFWFHSVYNRYYDPRHAANHPEQLYTTVKHRQILVQRTIDYIFYTPQLLQPVSMLSIPNIKTQLPTFLPAINYPSDHLAIASRFEWTT